MSDRRPDGGWAVGHGLFAAIVMITLGIFHAVVGAAAIGGDEFFAVDPSYAFDFDVTAWGWIHLLTGLAAALLGFALLSMGGWVRAGAIVLVMFSALVAFAFAPFQAAWAIAIVAVDLLALWTLIVHGRVSAEP